MIRPHPHPTAPPARLPIHGAGRRWRCSARRSSWSSSTRRSWSWRCRRSTPISRFSAGDLQWVLSAYLLSFGGLLLLGGRAADLLGRRRVFMVGTVLFALASLACGLAGSATVLIAARVVQGVAAAIMTPTALSIVTTTFEEGAERNKALGIWAAIGGIGATAAWLVGGPITEELGWEWIFFINVPVALGVVALSPALLRESRDLERGRRFDIAGALTITAALVALVYAVVEAPTTGWGDARTLGLFGISARADRPLRVDRVALARPAGAAARVPLARARRRQPGAVRARDARLRDAVHPHAVRAGGAALLAARVRARLRRDAGDGGAGLDRRAGDRDQGPPAPDRRGRHGPDRPGLPVAEPGDGSTAATWATSSSGCCSSAPGSGRPTSPPRSPRSPASARRTPAWPPASTTPRSRSAAPSASRSSRPSWSPRPTAPTRSRRSRTASSRPSRPRSSSPWPASCSRARCSDGCASGAGPGRRARVRAVRAWSPPGRHRVDGLAFS